jgi:hypothetical protein
MRYANVPQMKAGMKVLSPYFPPSRDALIHNFIHDLKTHSLYFENIVYLGPTLTFWAMLSQFQFMADLNTMVPSAPIVATTAALRPPGASRRLVGTVTSQYRPRLEIV